MRGSFSNKKVVCIVLFSIFMLVLLWGGITIHNANSTITEISIVKNLDALAKNPEVNSVSEAFNSKQLIIMSNNSNFKSYGAERIQNYDNMYIAYYKTKLGAKYAYSMLKNSKDIAYISINNILEVSEEGEEIGKERDTQVEETELGKYINSLRVRKGVRVAILDTGLNIENFKGKYEDIKADYTNETENSLSDTNGHGTKMAELIYENSNDSVNILPIKIANSEGKTSVLNVYLGIKKAIEAKADIVNLSMTASKSSTSEIITEAINEATEQGILVVVSAGNNKKDVDNITPANIESAIVISAVGSNKEFANYSNYGSTVDFSAVGVYKGEVGTSFATARVSGILANALTKGTDLETIAAYAEDLGEEGKDRYYGKGLLALSIENGGEDYAEGSNDSSTSIKEESTVTPDQPNEQVHDHEHEHVNEQELKELINSQNPDASLFESQVIPEDIVVFTTNEDFDVTKDFYNISYNSNNFKLEYVESVPSFKLEDGYYRVTYKATELTSGYYFNFYRYISVKSPQEGIEYDLSEFKEDVLTIASGVVDVTNATTGGIIGHTCVGTHMSDATQHWQECNICGEEISGTRGTHVYVGDKPSALPDPTRGECAPTNNYTQICSCGRSISVPRKEHINIVTNRQSGTQFYHYAACDCNSWVAWYNNGTSSIQMCTHNGVIINCFTAAGTARTCDTCGNTHKNKGHSLQLNELGGNTDSSYAGSGGITCAYCNNVVLNVKCSGAKYSNNYSNVTLEYLITPVRGTLSAGSGWINGHDENIHSLSTTISASGSGYLLKIAGTLSDSAHGNIRAYQWAQNIVNTVNGTSINCAVYTHNYFLYKDHNEPQISSCTAVSKNITDGWGKGVDITITGTEDTTERVKAKLYNASGTLIQEKEVAVSNKSYTVNFSPAYESKDGETWQVDIVDLYGNTVNAYFNMPKCVDATLPVSGGYSIDNTTWTKTKTLTITAYDYGAGDLQFNLNGLTNYESYDSVSGNTYKKTFTLTGNVFSPKQLAVYIRDGAGNIRTTYVTVDALDNTSPTISNAVATVNGASATISITASDGGVGVSNYAITTTNTAPTTGWSTSKNFTVSKSGKYYVWALDYAGNISASKICTVNLNHTVTVNLDGASYYKPDGTYVANGTTWSKQFTYGTPINVIGTSTATGDSVTNIISKPTKVGMSIGSYSISGGSLTESNSRMLFDASYDGDVTININWTPNKYKITLEGNNGSFRNPDGSQSLTTWSKDFTYNQSTCFAHMLTSMGDTNLNAVAEPTRVGHKFAGWKLTSGGGSIAKDSNGYWNFDGKYAGNVVVTAQWTPNKYKITLEGNNGSFRNPDGSQSLTTWSKDFTYNQSTCFAHMLTSMGDTSLNAVAEPTRVGYTFTGWKITSGGGSIAKDSNGYWSFDGKYAGNVVVTAQWDINKSTLTVYPNGGSWSSYGYVYSKSFTQNYNTTLAIPDPVKPNYTATFNANGGTCTLSSAKTNVAFSSWNTNSIGTAGTLRNKVFTFGPTKDGSGSIQALWNGSYDVTLPTPSRVGYTFNGWYTAATGGTKVGNAGTKITLSSDITYYAQWTPNKYDLTVNPNGGWMYTPLGALTKSSYTKKFTFDNYICYISTGTVEFYNADYLAVSLPERPGYTFRGWKITSGGGSVGQRLFQEWWDYDASYAGNVTVTAQWEPNLYNLTINPNGGEFIFAPINISGSNTYNYRQTASYTRKFVFGKETVFSILRNDTIRYYSESLSDIYNKSISGGTSRPIRRGYTLNSWSSPVNSSGVHSTTNSYGEVIQNGVKSNSSAFSYTGDYAGDITISANWLANKYSIKYLKGATDCSDSLTPSAQSATYDTNVTLQKSGSLKGRSYEITLDSNIPSTASTASTYNITSNKISGNLVFSSWETQKENNTELSWGTDSYGGYAYMNYGYDLKNYSSGQTVTKANFTSVPNGQVTATARYNSTTITPYTPSMTGYLFKGWYTDKACTAGNEVTSLKIDESTSKYTKTLYAKWEPIKYTVVYHGNSHWNLSQGDYTQELTFDATERLTTCKFTRIAKNPGYTHRFGELEEGYDFIGWTKTKNSTTVLTQTAIGTGKSITYVDGAVGIFNLTATNGATIDLYTIWRKDLSLAFNLNGGLYNGKDTINTLEVYIWNNSYEYNFNINDYYGTVTNNGLNSKLGKVDEAGNIYRFLGWSLNKDAVVPDSNFIVYDSNRVNGYVIQDDKTLYAVWEKILIVNYDVGRTKGEQEPESEALPGVFPSIKNITAITSNPSASVIIKPGEEGYYKLDIAGTPTSANAVFSETVTNMYTEITPDKWKDQFNQPDSESKAYDADLGITKSTSGLNKKLAPSRLIKRTFHVPVYFADAYSSNYFTLQHTIQQESYYYKNWVSGKDKEEIKIKTLVYIDSSPGDGDRPSTLDELKSLIKTKIVQ